MGMWWYSSHWMATHHHISMDCSSHYLNWHTPDILVSVDTWDTCGQHQGISVPHNSEPHIITLLSGKEESARLLNICYSASKYRD